MRVDGQSPGTSRSAQDLGVRVPGDIETTPEGNVLPNSGGMSVAPRWRDLPAHRIPRRLRHMAPGATGSNLVYCWRFGANEFASGPFANRLHLAVTLKSHGTVEPEFEMPVDGYRQALAETREAWEIDET